MDYDGGMGRKRRVTRLDLHLHTPTSDGFGKPAEYVRAIAKARLDGIVITDHHVTKSREKPASLEVARVVREAGYICLHGCEYSSDNGHVLIYGVDVGELDLGRYMPLQEVVWRTREAGGVAVPSHPYHGYRRKLGDGVHRMRDLTALEGYNGQLEVQAFGVAENEAAREAAGVMGLPVIGSSDAHVAYRIGTCYTEFEGLVRRNGDLVEALLDPAVPFRPVVNRHKVAAQRRVGHYSSRGLLDRSGDATYAGISGGRSWVQEEDFWKEVLQEEDSGEEVLQEDTLDDSEIPPWAFRGHEEFGDVVSDDPATVQAFLQQCDGMVGAPPFPPRRRERPVPPPRVGRRGRRS